MSSFSTVAAFDFDHTLTDRDSLLPFLFYMKGFWKTCYYLTILGPDFFKFGVSYLSRQGIKEKILTRFMRDQSFFKLKEIGEYYANQQLDSYLKPEALKKLKWHQSQGHRCILVSASLDFYLKPWATRHGFEAVLSSQLELTSNGLVTGRLQGVNCWGKEKVHRLVEYLGPKENYCLYAYGDSRGDLEMLALADHAFYRSFE